MGMNLINVDRIIRAMEKEGTIIINNEGYEIPIEDVCSIVILRGNNNSKEFKFDEKEFDKLVYGKGKKKVNNFSLNKKTEADEENEEVEEDLSSYEAKTNSLIFNHLKLAWCNELDKQANIWYACIITKGTNALYPIYVTNKDKQYTITMYKNPIAVCKKVSFIEENINDWRWSPFAMVRDVLKANDCAFFMHGFILYGYQNKDTKMIKILAKELLQNEKDRISAGNTCINMIAREMGFAKYRKLKIDIALDTGLLTEEDLNTLTDKEIMYYVEHGRKVEVELADGTKKMVNKSAIKIIDYLYKDTIAINKLIAEQDLEGKIKNDETFNKYNLAQKYITRYTLWAMIDIFYIGKKVQEEKSINLMNYFVGSHPIWTKYLRGIKGIQLKSAGFLIAYLDPSKCEHASGYLRYCGLDQITLRSEEINSVNYEAAIEILFRDYEHILTRNQAFGTLDESTFSQYKTDAIPTWNDYVAVENTYMETDGSITPDELDEYPEFMEVVNYVSKFEIQFIRRGNRDDYPIIHKRARRKNDRVSSTYLTADGKLSVKEGLGYNTLLKGIILGRIVGLPFNMNKNRGSHYGELIEQYKNRILQSPKAEKLTAKVIERMAFRHCAQIFLEDLWLASREIYGMPLNGGRYSEAKLGIVHDNGIVRPEILNGDETEAYIKANQF